ncbi:GAF domain-containing protein [Nocardioides sp.]|uniref:sensor histidine kinase n=1 Tax=Nocardioides sp. TaxID=35761 RepID=UPI00286CABF1|nr:GAF domain-containing protein [Nocardioides sp.]
MRTRSWDADGPDRVPRREQQAQTPGRRVRRAYRTIAALNQAVVLAREPDELFAEACRIAVEEGGYLGSWVVARGEGTSVRTLARAGAITDHLDRIDFTLAPDNPLSAGPTATALLEDRPVFSADATEEEDAPWHQAAAAFGIRGTAALPLRREGTLVAVISLWSDGPRVFEGQHRELLEGLADNISFALDGFAASAGLARLAQQRTDLLRRVVAAQEEERSRIAADVHDESVQALAAVDLRLGLLARRVQEVAPDLASSVAQLQETVASVGNGLRDLLFELETPDTEAGFDEALREAAGHVFEHCPVRWSLRAEHQAPTTSPSTSPTACTRRPCASPRRP